MTTSNSDLLCAKIHLVKPALDDRSARMWSIEPLADTYALWLRTLHGLIRATVPLMLTALEECLRRTDDPIADQLARYFAKHVREEFGHDQWVLEDLARFAGPDPMTGFLPGPEIAALVGSQYYWIKHVHPVALMGHIAVLEGYPPGPELAPTLAGRSGLPLEAFSTIERHATLDVKHRDEVLRTVDRLPLDGFARNLLGTSALATIRGMIELIDAIVDRLSTRVGAVG